MLYVGLDIHSKSITICILNDDGQLHRRGTVRQIDQMMTVLEQLLGPFDVCYEASSSSRVGLRFDAAGPALVYPSRISGH